MRIGQSTDIHRLAEGRKLILGGVEIPSDLGLVGHSDADALCHAVAEAILGALALGDLGKWFPDTDPKWEGADSIKILEQVGVMMRQRGGYIINMGLVFGVHGNAGQANYAASKAGMIALAKSVGQEMGPKGIRANAIAPGFIDTAMTQALPENIRKEWISKIPLRRGGTVEDIANTALFLASDLSSYVCGQVIQVDGGMNM